MNDLISMDLDEVMIAYAEYEADGGWETYEMLDYLLIEQYNMDMAAQEFANDL